MTAPSAAALLQDAVRLHQQGRLAEAERSYRAALAAQPKNFDALYMLATLTMQQGRAEEASKLAKAAVECNPSSADALMLLGSVLLALERGDEAIGCFDRAVAAQPKNIDAVYNRAVALEQLQRLPQALADYDRVVALKPDYVEAWFNRGNVLIRLGRCDEAVTSLDRALALKPNNPDALNNRGNALAACGRHLEAIASFDAAAARNPDYGDALSNRANSLKALGRLDDALTSCDRALARNPRSVLALATRGNVLHAMGRYDEAVESYDRALTLQPADLVVTNNRGASLIELGRFHEALANGERAVTLDANSADAYCGRANALHGLERYDEAIHDYRKAIALRPDFNWAKWNLSLCFLSRGQFAEGWRYYASRWAPEIAQSPSRGYPQPLWDGKPLRGSLLVWGDQGLGDQIIYASIIPELTQCADQAVIEVDARLVELYTRSFPQVSVTARAAGLYGGLVDAQVPMSSLPAYFRPDFDAFPHRDNGYLVADASRVRQLRERLSAGGRAVIGLTWISRNRKAGRFKSAQLKDFEPLLRMPGSCFVDLQYGDTGAERQAVEGELGVRIEHVDDIDNMNDIDGLAALAAACDVVLTVSSTTAHLAGAVGARTFVMVPFGFAQIWYWFRDCPASPWYPHVQVRRQAEGQSWAAVINTLAAEVAAAAQEQKDRRAR